MLREDVDRVELCLFGQRPPDVSFDGRTQQSFGASVMAVSRCPASGEWRFGRKADRMARGRIGFRDEVRVTRDICSDSPRLMAST